MVFILFYLKSIYLLVYKCIMNKLLTFFLSIFFISTVNNVFAVDYNKKVPGKNYTYRQYLIQRSLYNQLRNNSKEKELDGLGMTYNGLLKKRTEKDKNGKEVVKYSVYKRDCGYIDFPEEENEKLKEISVGTRIKFRLKGSNCLISDWSKF